MSMLDKVAELKHTPSEVKSGHDESTAKGNKAEFKAHEESANNFIGRRLMKHALGRGTAKRNRSHTTAYNNYEEAE